MTQTQHEFDIRKEARRQIVRLALPAFFEQVLAAFVVVASTVIVAHLGKDAIVAATWNGLLFNFATAIIVGLSTATTVLVSYEYGSNRFDKARGIFSRAVALTLAVGFVSTVIFMLFSDSIFSVLFQSADQKTLELATVYARYSLASIPFVAVHLVFVAALRGTGNNVIPLISTLIINITNLVLSYTLTTTSLGFVGAAIGVSVARILGAAYIVIYTLSINEYFKRGTYKAAQKQEGALKRLVHLSYSTAAERLVVFGGFLALNVIIVKLGTDAQTGYSIASNANNIMMVPFQAVAIAVTALIGMALGGKDTESAEAVFQASQKITLILSLAVAALLFAGAKTIANFYTADPGVLPSAIFSIRAFGLMAPLIGLSTVDAGALQGAGNAKYIALTMLVGLWLFRVMLAFITLSVFHWGLWGVFGAVYLDFGSRSVLYFYKMRKGDWKLNKV